MKEKILQHERIYHFTALCMVAVSMFVKAPQTKFILLLLGITGLLLLSVLKKQRYLIALYAVLMAAACVFYYIMSTGRALSV